MKKIFVTGGAGYLGSVLVKNLLSKGYDVTVFDALMFGGDSILPYVGKKQFHFIKGDVREKRALRKALEKNYDAIVHLAALVGEPACKVNPELTNEINYKATVELARIAKDKGVGRFIFTSTCSNYGLADTNSLATEDSPLNPLSLYAETKIKAEKELLDLNSKDFSVCITRLATIFGLSPKMRFNLFINEMVRDAFFGKTISLYKENAWRPYTHIEDASDALIAILEASSKKVAKEVFNIGSENYRKKDIIRLIKKFIKNIPIKKEGGMPDNRDYCVSFEKIKKQLAFHPKRTVLNGIEEIVWAMKKNIFFNPFNEQYSLWLDEKKLTK